MDQEVKALVEEVHERTTRILLDNREGFVTMAKLLLEKEVIFAEDIEKIFGPKVKPAEPVEEVPVEETTASENE